MFQATFPTVSQFSPSTTIYLLWRFFSYLLLSTKPPQNLEHKHFIFFFFFSWFNEPDSLIHDSVIRCSAGLFSRSHLIFLSACCYASSSVGVKDLKWPCSHVWEFGKDNKGFLHMISHLSVYYAFFVCVFQKVKTRN